MLFSIVKSCIIGYSPLQYYDDSSKIFFYKICALVEDIAIVL
jgi:hypothetical protein